MNNLNKENFWNEFHKKFPEAVDRFCSWIDEYKKRPDVEWDKLFHNYAPAEVKDDGETMHMVKFHDLPIAMQMGILTQFEMEIITGLAGWSPGPEELFFSAASSMTAVFQKLQIAIVAHANKSTTHTTQFTNPNS